MFNLIQDHQAGEAAGTIIRWRNPQFIPKRTWTQFFGRQEECTVVGTLRVPLPQFAKLGHFKGSRRHTGVCLLPLPRHENVIKPRNLLTRLVSSLVIVVLWPG